MNRKIIIIGQGIAGSCFARMCELNDLDFVVIDDHLRHSSSMIAAGMWNPIVFRKITKSWNIDDLLPYSNGFYKQLEDELEESFLSFYAICRLFASVEEQNNWLVKSDTPGYEDYLSLRKLDEVENAPVINDHGYGIVEKAGRVDLPVFLKTFRSHLKEQNRLIEEKIDYDDIKIGDNSVQVKDIRGDIIVFCEGHKAVNNPWFNWLPLQPNKGEVITIKAPVLDVKSLINKGFFVLPLGDNNYRVGATFDVKNIDYNTTEEAREKLKSKLAKTIDCKYEIIDQMAGIRPTVSDRRPLVGFHPDHSNMAIFNGMGTKGVTIAPLMANYLIDNLINNTKIPGDVDTKRFYEKINTA